MKLLLIIILVDNKSNENSIIKIKADGILEVRIDWNFLIYYDLMKYSYKDNEYIS